MTGDRDHFEAYYANKLWNLLPATYRTLDTTQFNTNGPLREMVNRLGVQAAILRRSIDRMWEDQSIETCDDWVIPYIADLVATRIVPNLDPPAQRLDVAKTIYYRRRKGTVAVLEQIANNITGWDAKVVEFFRRLGRTRHNLDPAVGLPDPQNPSISQLQIAQGLVGSLTRSPIGGSARLSHAYGATKAQTAFDEFFHTADFRQGVGQVGWQNIPHLGVFLWRLRSFLVGPVNPVCVSGCEGWMTFDPTGRNVPLFALASRDQSFYDSAWKSAVEAQLPTPISQPLFNASSSQAMLYPASLAILEAPTLDADIIDVSQLVVRPTRGRVHVSNSMPAPVWARYCYGFSSATGAGPYDRRTVRAQPPQSAPTNNYTNGGGALAGANVLPGVGTISINDSLTYAGANNVTVTGSLTMQAANEQRPLLRFAPTSSGWTEWQITGQPGSCLTLDGLFVSGADVVLQGSFDSVVITCCTFDPGSASGVTEEFTSPLSPASGPFAIAADGQELVPCRLWIEGSIRALTIQRSILGPIRTRDNGEVETLSVIDSIMQGIRTAGWGDIQPMDVKDAERLESVLGDSSNPISNYLMSQSSPLQQWAQQLPSPLELSPLDDLQLKSLAAVLNDLVNGPALYDANVFANVAISYETNQWLVEAAASPSAIPALNRSLLEDAFAEELADAALAISDGDVSLLRCTVMGRLAVHRLTASDCIFNGLAVVDDMQHGCVRFSATTTGSQLPRRYECAKIPPTAILFTDTDFGQPGYGQLRANVDLQISPQNASQTTVAAPTILGGADNGSEMGAFCLDKNPIKERALLMKFQEYMPAELVPVVIYAT